MGSSSSQVKNLKAEHSSTGRAGGAVERKESEEEGFNTHALKTRTAILDAHADEVWFESSPDYQYVDEQDIYAETKGKRTARKVAPSAAAEQFFWRIPVMGKSWDMYKAHVPATCLLLVCFAAWIGVFSVPYIYDKLSEAYPNGAKFCYGAQGVNGTYDYVPGSEVYVTSTQMCAITNSNSTETITESGTLPSLYIKDIHDILNTAWTAEVEADEFDITGYFLKGTPATGTIDQLNLATNNKWAWSNRLFYFGLPSEWYLIFTAGLLSPKVQCYELTVKSTAACPENSEGIRTVARSATTTTDHTTETWNLGSSREEGYIASEIGGGTEDWPQQLKRDTDGAYFVANYKWMDDALILLAFALPIIMALFGAFGITVGAVVAVRRWLKFKRNTARGKFKQLMEHGAVALGSQGNFIFRVIKDDGPGKSAGPKAQAYASTVSRMLKAWGCDGTERGGPKIEKYMTSAAVKKDELMKQGQSRDDLSPTKKASADNLLDASAPEVTDDGANGEEKKFLTREMEEVLHDFYVVDPFNNVVGLRSIVHLRDWEDQYRDDKRMWLLKEVNTTTLYKLKKYDDVQIQGADGNTTPLLGMGRLTEDQAAMVIKMAKANIHGAREFISDRNEQYLASLQGTGAEDLEKMDAWLQGVDVDKPIPSRFDMVRAFNDVPFLCCPISARESALVRAVRSQQADSSTPDEDLDEVILPDEIKTEHTAEQLDEIAALSRQGCCRGSGTTWYITRQRDGFDSNPTCAYGPMLFIEFLSAKLIEFFLSFLVEADTNTPVFLAALPKLRQELAKASEDPKLTAEQKADYQVMKVKQLLQTTEDPVLRRKTVKAIINFTHTAKTLTGEKNPRENEKILIEFPSSHYLLDGQAVPQSANPADPVNFKARKSAKNMAKAWWAKQLTDRDQWRATKKEGCCAGDELNGPHRSVGNGTDDNSNFDAGQPAWTPEERQTVIDRRIARLAMSPRFLSEEEKKTPEKVLKKITPGRPLYSWLQDKEHANLHLNQTHEATEATGVKGASQGSKTKLKYFGEGQKPQESAYLASLDICSDQAQYLDPAKPTSIDGHAALLKKSAIQRIKEFVEYPSGRGFMAEGQQGLMDLAKGWTTKEVLSVLMMTLIMIGSCAVFYVGVVAMAMWDHRSWSCGDECWWYAEIILIPGYLLCAVSLHELHAYFHHGMEFHCFRKFMRSFMNVLLTINCFATVVYIILTALWMILGCIVNPDKMSPYGMATGAFVGVAASAYATFNEKKEEITKIIMEFVDKYLVNGINLAVTEGAKRVMAGLPPLPVAVSDFLAETTQMLHEAETESATAAKGLKELQDFQKSVIAQTQAKSSTPETVQFNDLTFTKIEDELAKKYQITDTFSLTAALAKQLEFYEMLMASLKELDSMKADCTELNEVMSKDPSVPDQGTALLGKMKKLQAKGQDLRREGADATNQMSDNIEQKKVQLASQISDAQEKALATVEEATAALQQAKDQSMANAKAAYDASQANVEGAVDASKANAQQAKEATEANAKQLIADAEAVFEKAKKQAEETKEKLVKSLENAKAQLLDKTVEQAQAMKAKVEAKAEATKDELVKAKNRVTNQINDAEEIGRRALAEVEKMNEKVKEFFTSGDAIRDIQESVFEWLGLSPAGLIIALLGALLFLSGCVAFVFIGAAAFLGESAGTVIQSALIGAFGAVSALMDKSKQEEQSDKREDGCENIIQDLIEQQAKAIIGKISAAMDDQLSGMYAIMDDAQDWAKDTQELGGNLVNEAKALGEGMVTDAKGLVDETIQFGEKWKADAIEISSGLKDQVVEAGNQVVTTASSSAGALQNAGMGAINRQEKIVTDAGNNQIKIVTDAGNKQAQIVTDAAGNQVKITQNAAKTGQKIATGAITDTQHAVGGMASTVEDGIDEVGAVAENFSVSAPGTGSGNGMVVIDMSALDGSRSSLGRGAGSGSSGASEPKEGPKFAMYSSNLSRNNPEKYGNIRTQVARNTEKMVVRETVKVFSDPMLKTGDPRIEDIKSATFELDNKLRDIRDLIADVHDTSSEHYKGNLMFRLDRLESMCSAPRRTPLNWGERPHVPKPVVVGLSDHSEIHSSIAEIHDNNGDMNQL